MQWRRRHRTHAPKVLCLLPLLGLGAFLAHQVWLPRPHGGAPVTYGGGQAISADVRGSRRSAVPQTGADHGSAVPGGPAAVATITGAIAPGPFPYTINEPDKCARGGQAPFLVLLVAVEARQVEARNAIRQTWGNESVAPGPGMVRLFLLGRTEGELGALQQRTLEAESRRHRDIVQQDFLDSYQNLTLKTLMGMNWVGLHCPGASYVMKTDSDVFVNTEYLVLKLLRPDTEPRRNYFTGNNMRGFGPNRNKNSKWYMPPEVYPGDRYPPFCSGTGYVFSGDLAAKIYGVSLSVRRLHLEDVYVGVCLARLGVEPTPPANAFLFNHWRVSYSSCKYSHLVTSHGFHPSELLKYWHHLQSNKRSACAARAGAGRAHP